MSPQPQQQQQPNHQQQQSAAPQLQERKLSPQEFEAACIDVGIMISHAFGKILDEERAHAKGAEAHSAAPGAKKE